MAGTTSNYSLRFPEDPDPVDIAQDIQNLAEDSDAVLNTLLEKTGGTMTGALTLYAAPSVDLHAATKKYVDDTDALKLNLTGGTLTGDLSIIKATAQLNVKSTSTGAILWLESAGSGYGANIYLNGNSSGRWLIQKDNVAESGSNTGSDFKIHAYNDAGSLLSTPLSITRSTGLTTLTSLSVTGTTTLTGNVISNINVYKSAAAVNVESTGSNAIIASVAPSGYTSRLDLKGASNRWIIQKNGTAESSTATGSDLEIKSYDNTGAAIGTPLTITRSTGAMTLTGDLTISKASGTLGINSTSGYSYLTMQGAAGAGKYIWMRTGTSDRWVMGVSPTAESGSNAGSNFELLRYSDAGSSLGIALSIVRSTGAVTLTGDLTINKGDSVLTNGSGSGSGIVNIKGAAGNSRHVRFLTGTSRRWDIGANSTAESGSSAGSDFVIAAFDDGGGQTTPLTITRSTGAMTLTGNLTVSKGTAQIILDNTDASGDKGALLAGTSGVTFVHSNTGSFYIMRNSDASILAGTGGAGASISLETTSVGKVIIPSSGATAGLELGTSGPRMMSGTGSPEGAVTAPVGSIWFQTDSTVGVTHWKKVSGSGNTGWYPMDASTMTIPVGARASLSPFHGVSAGTPIVQGSLYLSAIKVPHPMTISEMGIRQSTISTAGALWRLGLYELDGTNGAPGTLIADLGTVDPTVGASTIHWLTGLSIALPAGRIAFAIALQGSGSGGGTLFGGAPENIVDTTGTACAPSHAGWQATGVTGALPATITANTGSIGFVTPNLIVKRSA